MDVFVIPVGRERYELYCEPVFEAEAEGGAVQRGVFGRVWQGLSRALCAADERQRRGGAAPRTGWFAHVQDRMLRWVAERVAEQRLLWNLRGQTSAVLVYPQDMSFSDALAIVRQVLRRDYERHRRWMIIDGIAFLVTFVVLGPLFLLVPGVANLPALYFGFRVVGHWLSMRGAVQGLQRVQWTGRDCGPLSELRDVASLEPAARDQRVHEIAARLRLPHLSRFFERVAVP